MSPNAFIHIKSAKFPILPGEEEELVNEGMYGKALALYLESSLKELHYDVPFICCEDWGWWVEIKGQPFTLGVCIYGSADLDTTHELCVMVSIQPGRKWSWKRFGFVDTTSRVTTLFEDLRDIFQKDEAVQVLGFSEECPFG